MPIEHHIIEEKRYVRVTWTGTITIEEVAAAWTRMFTDPAALAVGRSLSDVRRADARFSSEDLRTLVMTVGVPLLAGRMWRDAVLVARPYQFGMSRQFSVYTEAVAA